MRRIVVALSLIACACGRAPAPPATSAPAASAAAPSAPATSSLPLVRGVAVLTAEAPRLTPCGQTTSVALRDETGGALPEAYGQLASADTGEMFVELRAERGPQGVVARELVRALPVGEGSPCDRLLAAGEIRAMGNEPFWAVTVTAAGLELAMPDLATPLVFTAGAPAVNGSTRTWTAELPGEPPHRLELVVGPSRCKDGMSGGWFALAAEAVFDGTALAGCAYEGG